MIASVLLSASAFQQGLPSRVGSVTMCGACPFARARRLRSAIACRPRVFFPLAGAPGEIGVTPPLGVYDPLNLLATPVTYPRRRAR